MKESSPEDISRLLKPYRAEIDRLDVEILKLLGQRFEIVRKVAAVKIEHNIPAFLGDRVEQVKNNAAGLAEKYGIDPEFIRTLYTLIIYQSCALEDTLKFKARQKKQA